MAPNCLYVENSSQYSVETFSKASKTLGRLELSRLNSQH